MDEQITEREKELIEKVANLEQDKANLVGELTETRSKKQLAEQELEKTKGTPKTSLEKDPRQVVEEVLREKENEIAKSNLELAREEFLRNNQEFSPDVDKGGILYSKFEKELSKFNLAGLKTKEEYIARMSEARRLMDTDKPTKKDFYAGATDLRGTNAKEVDGDSLGASEIRLIQEQNWTKERYLQVKAKRPQYVASLLKYY